MGRTLAENFILVVSHPLLPPLPGLLFTSISLSLEQETKMASPEKDRQKKKRFIFVVLELKFFIQPARHTPSLYPSENRRTCLLSISARRARVLLPFRCPPNCS
jgi:hypothetical protein